MPPFTTKTRSAWLLLGLFAIACGSLYIPGLTGAGVKAVFPPGTPTTAVIDAVRGLDRPHEAATR